MKMKFTATRTLRQFANGKETVLVTAGNVITFAKFKQLSPKEQDCYEPDDLMAFVNA
jgi:hypothetical protein